MSPQNFYMPKKSRSFHSTYRARQLASCWSIAAVRSGLTMTVTQGHQNCKTSEVGLQSRRGGLYLQVFPCACDIIHEPSAPFPERHCRAISAILPCFNSFLIPWGCVWVTYLKIKIKLIPRPQLDRLSILMNSIYPLRYLTPVLSDVGCRRGTQMANSPVRHHYGFS